MKRHLAGSGIVIVASIMLLDMEALQLHAQTPPAEYLPMGPYTNDFSAPMPNWWFHCVRGDFFDSEASEYDWRDLSPFVYSNDYALATEGLVNRFAAHAVICFDDFFWMRGGFHFYAGYPYWEYYGYLDESFLGMDDVATQWYAVGMASYLWGGVEFLGGDGSRPWNWGASGSGNAVNIGQLKNAFSFSLDDDDGDLILDAYEYREFGALDFVDDIFDDPGGDGLCLLAEFQRGLDPLAGPEPFAITTNETAEALLFQTFEAQYYSEGCTVFEREFAINRRNGWQQYFLKLNDSFPAQCVRILYSDIGGGFHEVGGLPLLAAGDAIRLDDVSTNQTALVIRVETAQDPQSGYPGYFSCPSLSLVSWVPKVEFPGLREIRANGRTFHVATAEEGRSLSTSFTVDWSDPPDGSDPAEWEDAPWEGFPLYEVAGLEIMSEWDAESGVLTGGTVNPLSAGAFPIDSISALPSAAPPDPAFSGPGDFLLLLAPRLDWPGARGRCGAWLDYDPVTGTYTNASAYPLDSRALRDNWHFLDDRACGHAPEPTLDLGDPSLDGVVNHSFAPVAGETMASRCTITLGGSNIWSDVVSHYCPDSFDGDCHSESRLSEPDCDCDGSDVDGDSFGSCSFRLALGFPMLDTVSGFLWFRSEGIPRATPAMLSLMVRDGASVTCERDNPGGAISHVRCLDPRGRDITVAPVDNGLRLTVSNSACTYLDHSWEITNPGNSYTRLRIRKISRLGNPLSDRTYELSTAAPPDAMFANDSHVWRRTDNLAGLVETRIVSDGLNVPGCRARCVEEIQSDAASGTVYSYSQSRFALLGEGFRAVLRETNRVERTWDAAHPRETCSSYWENPTNRLVHGKARLTYGDLPWTYRAYDALGRETLRLSQLDGSQCPTNELETLRPVSLAAAIAAIPASISFAATVTDYAPLQGDSGDDLDASLPRTVSEYEVCSGMALPAARTWTVYDRDGWDDDWDLPVLSVRTERAASPTAAFGDQGNAVSTETTFDIRDGLVRSWLPVMDGMPVETTGEDGLTTVYSTYDAGVTFDLCGSPVSVSHSVRQKETDLPLAGRAADPMRPARIRVIDESRGTELFSGSVLRVGNKDKFFDFRYNLYDDQDRLRATFLPDGSSTTNAYSCCRLLWSQDRDGRRTVRSALTGEDRLYYANLETSLGHYPHWGAYGPYADRSSWYNSDHNSFRITQHFMDAAGRETNTVTGVLKKEEDHHPATRSFSNSNTRAWRSNATVSYPDGVSGHSVSTDARGLVTESFSGDFPDRTESVTFSYPRGEPANAFSTNTVVSYRNGAHVSERRWDGGWTRTTDSSFLDALGRRTSLSVTEASDLARPVTNSLSVTDFLGRTILAETPLSSVTYVYDGATSRVVSETDSKSGVTTLHHYDAYGEPAGSTRLGVTSLSTTSHAVEDGDIWRVASSIVSNGVKTASTAETRERLTGLSDALRSETVSIVDGVTNSLSSSVYDDGILTVTTMSPTRGTNVAETVYGVVGAVHDAAGSRLYCYDPYGRLFHTLRVVPGNAESISVNITGRDSVGDVVREDAAYRKGINNYFHYHTTCHGYDCRGNRVATTNALGGVERRAYDALGRLVAVWGSAARPTLYAYDTQGRRTSLSTTRDPTADAVLSTLQPFSLSACRTSIPWDDTEWRFDPATGLCLNKVYPDGTTVTNAYTPDGLLSSRVNASWLDEHRSYDENRRLVSRDWDYDPVDYEYDAFGNCVRAEFEDMEVLFGRDDRGAVTNETVGYPGLNNNRTPVATAYDAYGRVVSRTARGQTVHYAYAHDGRLATVSNGAFRVDYLYTPDRLDAGYVVTTAGGVEIARHVSRDTYRRHLVTDISTEVDGDEVRSFSYSYDALGRPVSRNGDDFAYNDRSEVAATAIGEVDAEYFYDPAGNRTTSVWDSAASVYTANGLNQYGTITAGGVTDTLSHDAWGNLTDTRPFSYFYAYDNRLLTVYTNRTSGARTMVSYDYDAMQRVYYRTVSPSGGASRGHRYHYSGRSLQLEDVSGNGPTATKRYVWGKDLSDTIEGAGGVGGLLATEVGGTWYFPLYDNNGNVTDYVSEDGEVVASYEYDAFGRTIAQSGAMADEFPFRFSTKYYDAEAKLYYYGERFYSPELGRWMNRDPIEEDGGDNLYAFCGNNGVNVFDANGKSENNESVDYASLVEWNYEVQYHTYVYRPMHVLLPIPIKAPVYAAIPQELSGSAPRFRKRLPDKDCGPFFEARKLTVYAIPKAGFVSTGPNSVYNETKELRYEALVAIVPSGSSPEGHWEKTWSDVRLLWRYEGKYASPLGVKKHVDCFFYGTTSGTWDVYRAIEIYNEERNMVFLEKLTFKLDDTYIGDAPGR